MFSRHQFVVAFCRCQIARSCFEFFGERLVIEEYPRILCLIVSSEPVRAKEHGLGIFYSI